MASKRCASTGGSGGGDVKRERKSISLEMKLDVIARYERGDSTASIKKELNLGESTLRTIRDNAGKIKSSAKAGTPLSSAKTSYVRSSVIERMEKMLAMWIADNNKRSIGIGLAQVQEKARSLYEELKVQEEGEVKPFSASSGWFANFKKRYSFHNVKSGEYASADHDAAARYQEQLRVIIEEGGYLPKQIFSLDETGLYWKRMPDRTYISMEEKTAPGFKAGKDRLTLLFGANLGGHKLKPLVVYHSENPRALKGYHRSYLPVYWYSSHKGWMTTSIMKNYFNTDLRKELELYCRSEGMDFKILILLDRAPSHPSNIADLCPNIRVEFLPVNTTSLLQPMDQQVIKSFKAQYLKRTMDDLVGKTDRREMTVREYWRAFNIKNALGFIDVSWKEVPCSVIESSWHKLCPYFTNTSGGLNAEQATAQTRDQCVRLAQRLGLGEVEESDVNALLECHDQELTNEDLFELEKMQLQEEEDKELPSSHSREPQTPERNLTVKGLSTALSLIEDGLALLVEQDPNLERSSDVQRKVLLELGCYRELLRQKRQRAAQQTFQTFLKKETLTAGLPESEEPCTSTGQTVEPQATPTAFSPTSLTILLDDSDSDVASPASVHST